MSRRLRVYADTNALFPYYLSDLLLWLSTDWVIQLLWTDYLVEEILEVVPRSHRRTGKGRAEDAVARQWEAARRYLQADEITEQDWKAALPRVAGPDPDDLPHAAAAIAGRADVLVTANLRDFDAQLLLAEGVRVARQDEFLCELLAADPEEVVLTLRTRANNFHRPALSFEEYLEILARSVPGFATRAAVAAGRGFGTGTRLRLLARRSWYRVMRSLFPR